MSFGTLEKNKKQNKMKLKKKSGKEVKGSLDMVTIFGESPDADWY